MEYPLKENFRFLAIIPIETSDFFAQFAISAPLSSPPPVPVVSSALDFFLCPLEALEWEYDGDEIVVVAAAPPPVAKISGFDAASSFPQAVTLTWLEFAAPPPPTWFCCCCCSALDFFLFCWSLLGDDFLRVKMLNLRSIIAEILRVAPDEELRCKKKRYLMSKCKKSEIFKFYFKSAIKKGSLQKNLIL